MQPRENSISEAFLLNIYRDKKDPFRAFHSRCFKGALSGLRQFLATKSLLKMMKMFFISPQKLFSFSGYLSFFS